MGKKYIVSDTTLEAEWIQDTRPLMSYYEYCSNCNVYASRETYPTSSYFCGKYCTNCGARMSNTHRHVVEVDYDD